MSQKNLLDVYDHLVLSFSPIEKLFQTMSASDTEKHGQLANSYGEIGERLSERFRSDLKELLLQESSSSLSE